MYILISRVSYIIPTIATDCCTLRKGALHHYVWEVRYRNTRIFGRIVDIGQTDTKGTNETDGFFFIFCSRFNRHLQSRLCSYLTSFVYQQNQNTQQWQASITSHQLVSSWHGVHHITEQPPTYWVLNMSEHTKKQRKNRQNRNLQWETTQPTHYARKLELYGSTWSYK
jgi:hypothetical protein